MQPANAVLPGAGFDHEKLLAPEQAMVAFCARVRLAEPRVEHVSLDDALGRILARNVEADDDYPNARRSAMDGFALAADATPGRFEIAGDVLMGQAPQIEIRGKIAMRIPTGGVVPAGADAVVPVEDTELDGSTVVVRESVAPGQNVIERAADMRGGERVLPARTRIGPAQLGVLATLGVTSVPVFRQPVVAVLSSGDELIEPWERPLPGQVRDSNRYAIAGCLRAMGAVPRHYPRIPDEAAAFEEALATALRECDAVAMTGGSSVGERDRLPPAVASLGKPGIVVHGLRIKPGKPTLLGALGNKPILGLPGNPTSALMVLEAVVAPVVAALTGARARAGSIAARLGAPVSTRAGWTWYVPVTIGDEAGGPVAHPLPLRSFSVSLTARADGYLVIDERDDEWAAGRHVTVHRFLGG